MVLCPAPGDANTEKEGSGDGGKRVDGGDESMTYADVEVDEGGEEEEKVPLVLAAETSEDTPLTVATHLPRVGQRSYGVDTADGPQL